MASFFLEERVQEARLSLPEINNLHEVKDATPNGHYSHGRR
jgi:hypothetical protein